MSDNFILKSLGFQDSSDATKNEIPELQAIDARLLIHQVKSNGHGLISQGIDALLSTVWHGEQDSQKSLEALRAEVVSAQLSGGPEAVKKFDEQIRIAVEDDKKAISNDSFKDGASNFVGDVAVAAPLFVRGSRGRALSALSNGVNDISAGDGLGGIAADATLGAAKGYVLSRTFETLGKSKLSPAGKGTVLGILNRTETDLLTAANYRDANGQVDIGQGLGTTMQGAFNPYALATDVAGGLASRSLAKVVDGRFNGILSKNPIAANLFTGSTIGLISGASGEVQNESRTGNYDAGNIFTSSIEGAGSSALSSILGRRMEQTRTFAPTNDLFRKGQPATDDSIMLPHPDVKAPEASGAPPVTPRPFANISGKPPGLAEAKAAALADSSAAVPTAAELGQPVANVTVPLELRARPIETVRNPETDIAVIGNGVIGMTLANKLAAGRFALGNGELRPRVAVLSANDLAQEGNSHQMTGMTTRAIDGSYKTFLETMGPDNFAKFLDAVKTGQLTVQDLARRVGVFRPSNSYYFAYDPNNEYLADGLKPLSTADPRNSFIFGAEARRVQPWMAEAIRLTDEGNVDPSKFLLGIAAQKSFGENVQMLKGQVTGIHSDDNGVTVRTADGSSLRAKMAIVATNTPPAFMGDYSHTYEDWEGLTVRANVPDHNLGPHNYFDTETIAFFRAIDGDQISVGGDADTAVPLQVINRIFPNAEITNATAVTLPISADQRPVFDRFPGMHDRVFFAGLGSGTGLVFSGVGTDVVPRLLNGEPHPAPELWGLDRFENAVHIATH